VHRRVATVVSAEVKAEVAAEVLEVAGVLEVAADVAAAGKAAF
jgi:hypothetical protein